MKITWGKSMKYVIDLTGFAAILCLAMASGMAFADDDSSKPMPPTSTPYTQQVRKMVASDDALPNKANNPNANFKEPWLTGADVHEYLGLATLGSALATALTAPGTCHSNCANQSPPTTGTHQTLGRTTGVLALAAVATGLFFHWDDMHLLADGLKDPDTQHWLLGGAGALLLADAVTRAPAKSHAAQAEAGAALMLVAVKITW
jgi:hypothetical protein